MLEDQAANAELTLETIKVETALFEFDPNRLLTSGYGHSFSEVHE